MVVRKCQRDVIKKVLLLRNIMKLLFLALCAVIFFSCTAPAAAGNSSAMHIAWAERVGDHYEIFHANRTEAGWHGPTRITENAVSDVMPAISFGNDGIGWMVWTTMEENSSTLSYSVFSNGGWSEATPVFTGMKSNTAVTLVIDAFNIPWIAWAGFDGRDDEIFFSKWNGSSWDAPQQINTDDQTPDIFPTLSLGADSTLSIQWQGFDQGTYKNYSSRWNGSRWSSEEKSGPGTEQRALFSPADLPPFVTNPSQIAIHLPGQSIQSRRLPTPLR